MDFRVLLVENNSIILDQSVNAINKAPGFTLAAKYKDSAGALGQGKVFRPNLILLDIDLEENIQVIPKFVREYPHATILCLCTQWDAELTARVMRAGAAGCLVKPFSAPELVDAVKALESSGQNVTSEVITFFSPKGKSGQTTFVANMALRLAAKEQKNVAIIDANLQFGDMAIFFNLTPTTTIMEACRDVKNLSPVSLTSYFVPATAQVSVLCGTRRPEDAEKIIPKNFVELIGMVRSRFPYVLIDLSVGFSEFTVSAMEASDLTFLVASEDSVFENRHLKKALYVFEGWGDSLQDKLKLVYNRVQNTSNAYKQQLEESIGYPITAFLPNEYDLVSRAADEGRMASDIRPESKLSTAINQLLRDLHGKHQIRWEKS